MSKELNPWWKVAKSHKDIREGRFDASVFAANLYDVLMQRGPIDYRDARTFFKKTYITEGLSALLSEVLGRLSGKGGGDPIIQIQTPFGGGKTHTLIALYHLLTSAKEVEEIDTVRNLLDKAGIEHCPKAKTAVIVGDAYSPVDGRKTKNGVHIRTFWGELAYQLGGKKLYSIVEECDKKRVAPGSEKIRDILKASSPCLILLDELVEYSEPASTISVGSSNLWAQTLNFIKQLTEAVHSVSNVVVAATLPSSHAETAGRVSEEALSRLQQRFGRVEKIREPVAGEEIFEILKRRLFEDVGDQIKAKEVADAYWDYYQKLGYDIPQEAREPRYRERLFRAYPFHPQLVDILYHRLGSIPGFQRTRGALRLLALVIGDLYKNRHPGILIQPSHINLSNSEISGELIKLVSREFNSVIASDISGTSAKAPQIDREMGSEYAEEHLAEGISVVAFLFSITSGREKGATEAQIRLSILHPGLPSAVVPDALSKLSRRLHYLYTDNGLYRFSTQPNLNRILVDMEDTTSRAEVMDVVKATLNDIVGHHQFRVYIWPEEGKDIQDSRDLSLVIIDLAHPKNDSDWEETQEFIQSLLNQYGKTFRRYRNTVIFLVPDSGRISHVIEAGRRLLAVRKVNAEYGRGDQLSKEQKKDLENRIKEAESRLPQTLISVYRHVVVGGSEKGLRSFDMGMQAYTGAKKLSEYVWDTLKGQDKLLEKMDPGIIVGKRWALWPEKTDVLNTETLWNYFVQYTNLPMLAGQEVLKDAISKGVETGRFGYGIGDSEEGPFESLKFKVPLGKAIIELSETTWLISASKCQEILKPEIPSEGEEEVPDTERETPTTGAPRDEIVTPVPPGEKVVQRVRVKAKVPLSQWNNFYREVVQPLAQKAEDLEIEINIVAGSSAGIPENLIELTIKESLSQRGLEHEVDKD